MRDEITAADVIGSLHSAVTPFLHRCEDVLPRMPAPADLRALVVLQLNPLVARLVLSGPTSALEALRLTGPDVPGHVELEGAVETFVTAGLSALPSEVIAGIFDHAAKPGAGLVVLLDLAHGAAECLLAVSRCDLSRAVRLFSVGNGAKPDGPPASLTVH